MSLCPWPTVINHDPSEFRESWLIVEPEDCLGDPRICYWCQKREWRWRPLPRRHLAVLPVRPWPLLFL